MAVFDSLFGLDDDVVVVVRSIDVGVTIETGTMAVGGGGCCCCCDGSGDADVAIETGKNVDVFRNEVVDEFGDNGLRWYK